MYNAYITRLKNLQKHPNADRLLIGECFGNSIIVSLDYTENQLGVYFPSDGRLSMEFAEANNLLRKKDDAGNQIGGYMAPEKRNVTAIRLRGEKSDGLFLPLESLSSFGDISELKEGDVISTFNGHLICEKYIPKRSNSNNTSAGNRTHKKKVAVSPLFSEHADTEQLAYNLNAFKPGDQIEITLKMHGTSQRTGYLPVLKKYKRTILDKLCRREGTPVYDWGYVSGTRRTVLEDYDGGYYGSNEFREQHSKLFEGKLNKGETVYYEVTSFTDNGVPIMGQCKVPKEAQEQYGTTMTFHYGCEPTGKKIVYGRDENGDLFGLETEVPQSDMYVYRMTMTNEDGFVVEYTPDFMRYRCEQMGVKCVPVLWKGYIPEDEELAFDIGTEKEQVTTAGEYIKYIAEQFYDGPDPIGKTHVREGVVIRIINRPKFTAYKHKNFLFKQITGIIKNNENTNLNLSEDILSEL